MTCYALVPCAGSGSRSGTELPKQYALLHGRALVAHTLDALAAVPRLAATLVVLAPGDETFGRLIAPRADLWVDAVGGESRASSVRNGLRALRARGAGDADWVLVHDAARCLLRPHWVEALLDACEADAVGGLLALPLADTLKAGEDARVVATVDRRDKWAAQTPQMFRLALLERALDAAGPAVTDDASAVEALGLKPRLVAGHLENFKVTWPQDFALAERLLAPAAATLRIGEGWDIHALVSGRPLMLGGVEVPHSHGLDGHSDADALLHAITDALLGAAGLGDIGRHFPDTDPVYRGADSAQLLRVAAQRVRAAGWAPANVDATIIAQAPKMAPHVPAMRERIASILAIAADAVNVKAKTAEKMGPVGEGRAIEARAVCLLARLARAPDLPPA